MRLGDIQLAFPVLLLGVAVIAVLGASLTNMILVLGATRLDDLRAHRAAKRSRSRSASSWRRRGRSALPRATVV